MELVRKYVELEEKVNKQAEELAEIKAMLQEILQLLRGGEASEPEEPEESAEAEEEAKAGEGVDSPKPETTVEQEPTEPLPEQEKKPTVDNPDKQENQEPAPNLEKEVKLKEVVTPRAEIVKEEMVVETTKTESYEDVLKEVLRPLEDRKAKLPSIKEISQKLRKIRGI